MKLKLNSTAAMALLLLFFAAAADAFHCGRKLVLEDMHEAAVRSICGEPSSIRHLGHTVRGTISPLQEYDRRRLDLRDRLASNQFVEEVVEEVDITRFTYNFGPRRFMQRLVFDGGILMKIESLGFGYRDNW